MNSRLKKASMLVLFAVLPCSLTGCSAAGPVIAHVVQEAINGLAQLASKAIPSITLVIEDEGSPARNTSTCVQGPEIGPIVEGKRHGLFESYWNNGKLASHGLYLGGKKEGFWREWWPSGKLATESNYRNGRMIDQWCVWDEGGRVLAKGDFGH